MVSAKKRKELKKRKEEQLAALKKEHSEAANRTLFGKKCPPKLPTRGDYKPTERVGRAAERNELPSLKTNVCSTAKIETPKYTGDNLIGIALMHKSNYVPIFKKEDAVSVAKMRRN